MKRLICWWRGHRWRTLSVNRRKHANLIHLHPLAGCKAVCERCGEFWDDLWSPFFGDDVIDVNVSHPLPVARIKP